MKKNLLFFVFSLFCFHSYSQLFNWAKTISGTSDESATCITVDDSSNTYVVGYFQSTITFTKASGTISLTSAGSYDFFISKFDCAGNAIWATKIGGTGNEKSSFTYGGIVFNKINGTLVVCTSIEGTATAYSLNGSNQTLSAAGGSRDAIVASYGPGGNLNWINKFGSTGDDRAEAICTDPFGNIFVRGEFESTVSFGSTSLTSAGGQDLYLVKINPSSGIIWAIKDGGTGYEASNNRIATDKNGNVYVNGNTDGTFTLGSYTVTHYGAWGGYFIKYDSTGNMKWVTKASNTGTWEDMELL